MKRRAWRQIFIWVLPVIAAFALAALPQTVSAVEADEPELPVGGWEPVEMIALPDDIELPDTPQESKNNRKTIKGDRNSVFTRGASTVGYNALETQAQKEFYTALSSAAVGFMNAETDLTPPQYAPDHYVISIVNYANLGVSDLYDAMEVYYAFDYDHPAYYWLSNSVLYNDESLCLCTEEEYASVSARQEINALVSDGIGAYVDLAESGTDTLDKVSLIHDKIVNDIDYAYQSDRVSESARWAHSVQGVFDPEHRHAVCEGYADTFALAMNYMGIPNYYITGNAGDDETGVGGHAWNAVSVDSGETYLYMDLTWDDFEEDGYAYPYFGMPASDFETTHFKNDSSGTGSAWLYPINAVFNDSFEGTFYKQGGFFYDSSIDAAAFASEIVAKARRSGDYVSFIASSTSDLRKVANELGVGVSFYRVIYKDTEYYYMVVRVAEEHTHVLVAHEAVAPTCTEEGNTAYWECSECGRYFSDAAGETEIRPNSWIMPALGHNYVEVANSAVAATCETNGKEADQKCSRCGDEKAGAVILALGHQWQHYKAAAGYLKNGLEYDYCTVCNEKRNVRTLAGYANYYVKSFKVSKGKKAFTAKWKKQSKANQKKFNGYQIRYSLSSNMAGAKYATAGKASKSKKVGKLLKKKKYYVQVRTYIVSGGKTYYSKWSGKKIVTMK